MKKIIAIILATVLVLSFAACKKTDKNPDTTAAADAQTSEQAGDVTGEETSSILSAYSLAIDGKAAPDQPLATPEPADTASSPAPAEEDGAVTVPIYG